MENGVAREKEVELGLALGERVELTKGLKVGELLVVEGQYGIKDGTLVEWNGAQNNGRGETK